MNLELARKVLEVSEVQPFDFVKLRGRGIAWEVQKMESAGLVVLSAARYESPNLAVIKRVTALWRQLLRILRDRATALYLKRAFTTSGLPAGDFDLEIALL